MTPESKGGSESTVKIAKADLVPAEANLREPYTSFAELAQACREFCDVVNGRVPSGDLRGASAAAGD
jgi:hypothetical protein